MIWHRNNFLCKVIMVLSLSNYLLIARRKLTEFIPFPKVWVLCEITYNGWYDIKPNQTKSYI